MSREPHPCDDLPVDTWVWWCHHEQVLEQLIDPGRTRVDYIYSNKPKNELTVRLGAFRPVKDQVWATEANRVWNAATDEANRVLFDKLDEEYPGVPYSRETGSLIFPEKP